MRLKLLKIVEEPLPPKLEKANAAREKAYAAWPKAINSPAGVAFHKQVCGCAWTPVQPDILSQLAAVQQEQQDEA